MANLDDKQHTIMAMEEHLANHVAKAVIEKPLLSVWMILVPIFFVYYFWRLKKVAEGRKEFVKNFMITRRRAMEEACYAVAELTQPNVQQVVARSSTPPQTHTEYAAWVRLLIDHYTDLLQSTGRTYEELARSVWRNRTDYLLAVNQLGRAERRFNRALKPRLPGSVNGAGKAGF